VRVTGPLHRGSTFEGGGISEAWMMGLFLLGRGLVFRGFPCPAALPRWIAEECFAEFSQGCRGYSL
jgi:hypothetical protein